jgi:Flp pilus assembly protein TadG
VRKISRPHSSRLLVRFAGAERGATAVEFGLIAAPILVMMFGLLELALVFMVTTTLDTATQSAARQIRTGNFQTSASSTRQDFKNLVCGGMTWLSSKCTSDLWLDVQTFSDFNSLATVTPIDPTTFKPSDPTHPTPTCFSTGQPTDIVLVRAFFEWDLFTPLLNNALENMGSGSGKRLISSTTAFRNEPYNTNPPVGNKC